MLSIACWWMCEDQKWPVKKNNNLQELNLIDGVQDHSWTIRRGFRQTPSVIDYLAASGLQNEG